MFCCFGYCFRYGDIVGIKVGVFLFLSSIYFSRERREKIMDGIRLLYGSCGKWKARSRVCVREFGRFWGIGGFF